LPALTLVAGAVTAQDLTPRAYWPAPTGTRIAVAGYQYSTGEVVTDPSLPLLGVDSRINAVLLAYRHTLSLWGRTANLTIEQPYSRGRSTGVLDGEPRRREYDGFADLAVSLSVNLRGAPALTLADFRALREAPRPILGASLKLVAPTGEYNENRLINLSGNRWAVRAELGYMYPLSRGWLLEVEVGAWFFGDNDEFLGVTREQDPVYALQAHLVRRFRPGLWGSLDANFFRGGRSTIDGQPADDRQRNSRIGGTLVFPFGGRHAVKLGYSTGLSTESGGDYDEALVSYSLLLP
jgi:hypothetical protein